MEYEFSNTKQAGEIVQSFISISRILTKLTSQNAESLGLTLMQMGILNLISAKPEITLKEITDTLKLPKSTVSINIDNLVNLELISRNIIKENRREIHLTSTAKGKELSKKSSENAFSYKAMAFALEKLPKEDVKTLIETNKELLKLLQDFKL
ncbi:MarR family winged helix-turn-helix transcriptional regulator [Clostridium hydrogenum]|uniref:MarR family winged helix-turn-helix transcriptional regulator n=1 Tax=Clostridium hydrogenum TaxID=2855764 RepID=UPI001F19D372|nr:MarR family transcriptional regulator [Clostridium hydrogenum]